MDTDKSGMVKHEVFFELLNLHKIDLSLDAKNYLKKNYSKNQTINYKEALNQITIDLEAAGGNEGEDGMMKWTVFAFQKKSQIGDDSVSQAGSAYRYKQPLKSIGGLSKEKLSNFDKLSQPRDALSRIPSQVGSVVPSQAPTKSIVSKLDKIEEVPEGSPAQKTTFTDIQTQYLGEISKYSLILPFF